MSHKSSKPIIFYSLLAAGFMFIVIGFIVVYSYSKPAEVPLHGILNAGMTDILTPDMNMGGMANIIIKGSIFNVTITDPVEHIIKSDTRRTSDLYIEGHAQNKLNVIALSGPLMLIITGIIITGLAIRFKKR